MTWTVATWIAKASDVVGARRPWRSPYAVSHAGGIAQRGTRPDGDTVYARVFRHRLSTLNLADRKAVLNARDHLHDDGAVVERLIACGGHPAAAAVLAASWERWPQTVRDSVRNPIGRTTAGPVTWGSVPAVQVDGTTCGTAVTTMINAMADPRVALWIHTGQVLASDPPPCVTWVDHRSPVRTIEQRWHALQRGIHRQASVTVMPWPRMWGTSPWGLTRTLNVARVRWRQAWVAAHEKPEVTALAAHVRAALRDGIPVAAYVSGDASQGMASAVPRHVVAIVDVTDDGFLVYEPSCGEVVEVTEADLRAQQRGRKAWGRWRALNLVLLPALRTRPSPSRR